MSQGWPETFARRRIGSVDVSVGYGLCMGTRREMMQDNKSNSDNTPSTTLDDLTQYLFSFRYSGDDDDTTIEKYESAADGVLEGYLCRARPIPPCTSHHPHRPGNSSPITPCHPSSTRSSSPSASHCGGRPPRRQRNRHPIPPHTTLRRKARTPRTDGSRAHRPQSRHAPA